MAAADAFDNPLTRTIVGFLERIGIAVSAVRLGDDTFLPGLQVRGGSLLVDESRLAYPTDLLHEAGHIAVTEPALRPSLDSIGDDAGEEMAAIAWSYAASVELGIDAGTLFHDAYRGGGPNLADNFANGRDVGVPLLACYGLCADWRRPDPDGPAPYPHMLRWLR